MALQGLCQTSTTAMLSNEQRSVLHVSELCRMRPQDMGKQQTEGHRFDMAEICSTFRIPLTLVATY